MSKDLYTNTDPVTVIDDGSLIGVNCKIKPLKFKHAGLIKAYASWCGHCQAKVTCLNKLAKILDEFDTTVYVINAEKNPMFREHFDIRGYPTFLSVDDKGQIGDPLTDKDGQQVYTIPGIIGALCGNDERVCQYMDQMKDCS